MGMVTIKSRKVAFLSPRLAFLGRLLSLLLFTFPALSHAQFAYSTNSDNTINITGYTGPCEPVTIPSEINGLTVTSIGSEAFAGSSLMTVTASSSITIPDSVTSIGDHAFIDCYSILSVSIGNGVTNLGYEPFLGCNGLGTIVIGNGVTSFGTYEFTSLGSLTSITIGTSVTSIGSWAFASCDSLQNIPIPDSVTNIGDHAFYTTYYPGKLEGIYFKGNAPSVGPFAFYGDDNATAYYLPGTTNWNSTLDGLPAVLWNPQAQMGDGRFGVQTNGFGFNITGTAYIPIVVEANEDLTQPSWTPLFTGTITNGEVYFSDPQWTNFQSRFYHIRSP
jgi:hypothetical protein